MRNQQNVKVRVNSSFETICPFPVGYVYLSSNSTSPADIYGGTWSAISGGRYMRAAGAWGNGGSNTITINQMPSHTHEQPRHYVYDKGGWSSPINGNAVPQVAGQVTSTPFATPLARDSVNSTGGGQHSTPLTKTFGRGTELPREGDASCVTYSKFKSGLAVRLKGFVHSQLATSICQVTRQVQQTFMAARGHLSQMVDFGEQVAHGIVQAVNQHTNLLLMKCQITPIVLMFFSSIKKIKEQLDLYIIQETPRKEVLLRLMSVVEPHITTCRLIAPAIVGIVPLKAGEC